MKNRALKFAVAMLLALLMLLPTAVLIACDNRAEETDGTTPTRSIPITRRAAR